MESGGRGSVALGLLGVVAILVVYGYGNAHPETMLGGKAMWIVIAIGTGFEITWLLMRHGQRRT